ADRRARQDARWAPSVSARDRVRLGVAQDGDGQDPALSAALGGAYHFIGDTMAAFEAITGSRPWPARYTFSPAVRAGKLLFISGTTTTDDRGEIYAHCDTLE